MKCCGLGNLPLLGRSSFRSSVRLVAAVYVCVHRRRRRRRRYNITAHLSWPIRHFVGRTSRRTERDSVVVASLAIIAADIVDAASAAAGWATVAASSFRVSGAATRPLPVMLYRYRLKCCVINDRRLTPFTDRLDSADRFRLQSVGLSKLEEASTHKSAKTYAGTVFVTRDLDFWPFDLNINGFLGLIVEHL